MNIKLQGLLLSIEADPKDYLPKGIHVPEQMLEKYKKDFFNLGSNLKVKNIGTGVTFVKEGDVIHLTSSARVSFYTVDDVEFGVIRESDIAFVVE